MRQNAGSANIPLRLLDCLGFATPLFFLGALAAFAVVVGFRFGGVGEGGGSGAGLITGESRKTDGEGIVIVSISSTSGTRTLATPVGGGSSPASAR